MRTLKILTTIALAIMLCCCSNDSFTIECEIDGLGTQNVSLTMLTDDGVESATVTAHDGHFSFTGHSSELTVVDITDAYDELLAHVAVKNGDHATVRGNAKAREQIVVGGNDANEQWTQFRAAHASAYEMAPCAALDAAIEQWLPDNRSNAAAVLILLYDHSALLHDKRCNELLTTIAPEVRSDRLITAFATLSDYYSRNAAVTLHSLTLCGTGGDFTTLNFNRHAALVAFWSALHGGYPAVCDSTAACGVITAAVLLDADSTGWQRRRKIANDKVNHLWSPTGPTESTIKQLRVPATPWFIVTDSLGRIVYRGDSPEKAADALPQ